MKKCGIYKIVSPSGKIYIGSSKDLNKRFASYKNLSCKSQTRLYASFVKHGVDEHKFSIICECSESERLDYENLFGIYYDVLGKNGLNCNLPKYLENKQVISEETRDKIRNIKLGFKHSQKAKDKVGNYWRGRKRSIENKQNLSKAKKGVKMKDGFEPHNKKLIINTQSGVFYNGVKEASDSIGIKRSTLSAMLVGQNKNWTNFKYV